MFARLIDILKVIIIAIVEGISEWLPISSSGHMLLLDEFIKLNMSENFKELFFVVIQLGAILAVIVLFLKKIFPIKTHEKRLILDKNIICLWMKIIIACIPGAIMTVLFDNYIENNLHTPFVISLMLVIYGIIFILIESLYKKKERVHSVEELSYKHSFIIGFFQVLSLIPGTSRSGATIVGALLIGINRSVASEFTFFLAIPVMFGMSFIKLLKLGFIFSVNEVILLLIGTIFAFLVSLLVIKFLINFVKRHDFKIFGVYRIIIGMILLLYFVII